MNKSNLIKLKFTDETVDKSSLKTEEEKWLSTKEAADYLRLDENTLRNMTSNGKIPYHKLGRLNRYLLSDLKELLLSNRRGGF